MPPSARLQPPAPHATPGQVNGPAVPPRWTRRPARSTMDAGAPARTARRRGVGRMHLKTPAVDPSVLAGLGVVVLIDIGMILYCLNDLYRPDRRVNFFAKDIWAIIIVLNGVLFGPLYLLLGRENA